MALKKRQFTRDFKLQILREIEAGKSLAQAAREHQLHPTLIKRVEAATCSICRARLCRSWSYI